MAQVLEIRSYQLIAGQSEQFHQLMQEQCLPLLLDANTNVLAARPSLHSPDAYILIRAYANLAERERHQDAFYGSRAWLQGPRDAIMACIEHYTTVVVDPDHSFIHHGRSAA